MEWIQDTERRRRRETLHCGNAYCGITEEGGGQLWLFFAVDLGTYSAQDHEYCRKHWPREAIVLARQELDAFEEVLNHERNENE